MNRVVISGRFTKEHELRYNQSGTAILSNTIASNRKFKNKNGEYEADFINVVLFNQQAKFTADYSKKGDMALVEGRLQTRTYDDKEGKKVYVTEVIADSVELLTPKQSQNSNENTPAPSQNSNDGTDVHKEFGTTIKVDEIDDSDLPF